MAAILGLEARFRKASWGVHSCIVSAMLTHSESVCPVQGMDEMALHEHTQHSETVAARYTAMHHHDSDDKSQPRRSAADSSDQEEEEQATPDATKQQVRPLQQLYCERAGVKKGLWNEHETVLSLEMAALPILQLYQQAKSQRLDLALVSKNQSAPALMLLCNCTCGTHRPCIHSLIELLTGPPLMSSPPRHAGQFHQACRAHDVACNRRATPGTPSSRRPASRSGT